MRDPQGVLAAPGENSRVARKIPFTSLAGIEAQKDLVSDYIRDANEIEKAGLKVDLPKDDLVPPEELTRALVADPAFSRAFEALTPGRKRGWILHVSQPKLSATRQSRIEKARPRILEGKGIHDR
jgi:uncharacterized protein YdeI (YjbR/CyaY-like superfamily)